MPLEVSIAPKLIQQTYDDPAVSFAIKPDFVVKDQKPEAPLKESSGTSERSNKQSEERQSELPVTKKVSLSKKM